MFDLDPGKLIVIGIVALVAIPTKDLPRVLRQIGQITGRMRRMAADFQGQFMDAMREADLADVHKNLKSEVDSAFAGVGDVAFDPLKQAREQIVGAIEGPPAPPQSDESKAAEPAVEAQAEPHAASEPAPTSETDTPPESQPK
ncbi:sec-independent protein translocase protein TatB [Methylosinus sp. sav-2]|uniref:Sec-independent protein translocase subunit TatA/TatB n=1 Tax=Methylosinus sp. sav-2 TaxID=2485168 RepID=UPI00047DEC60|nr:protein translocase TatA [Methylosinus sp. sav-2]TDX65101.1 sec-independent protein translocase protein TatB [Methylosinus sp. sav-2]